MSIILASSTAGVIGVGGGIPWDIPADRRIFRQITQGLRVGCGRATYHSLPPAARERMQPTLLSRGGVAVDDFAAEDTVLIGGAEIYHAAAKCDAITTMYLTMVWGDYHGDVTVDLRRLFDAFPFVRHTCAVSEYPRADLLVRTKAPDSHYVMPNDVP